MELQSQSALMEAAAEGSSASFLDKCEAKRQPDRRPFEAKIIRRHAAGGTATQTSTYTVYEMLVKHEVVDPGPEFGDNESCKTASSNSSSGSSVMLAECKLDEEANMGGDFDKNQRQLQIKQAQQQQYEKHRMQHRAGSSRLVTARESADMPSFSKPEMLKRETQAHEVQYGELQMRMQDVSMRETATPPPPLYVPHLSSMLSSSLSPTSPSPSSANSKPRKMILRCESDCCSSATSANHPSKTTRMPHALSWRVYRRFSEFRTLHLALSALHQSEPLPSFPARRFWGSSLEPSFLDSRQAELSAWLSGVLARGEALNGLRLVHRFLLPTGDAFHELSRSNGVVKAMDGPGGLECKKKRSSRRHANTRFPSPAQDMDETSSSSDDDFDDDGDEYEEGKYGSRRSTLQSTPSTISFMTQQDSPRRVSARDFEVLRVIGRGSFGKVVVARGKQTNQIFAIKILNKSNIKKRKQIEHTKTERRVMAQLRHPYIVELHYAFQTRKRLYLVLEFVQGGELFYHLGKQKSFPESWARLWTAEIVLALQYLHERNIMFRDLKPENVLFDHEGHIKLIDFGLCKEGITDGATGATSFCGTPEYLAPEILDRLGHGKAVDFWSLGMVLHEMLTGLPPWYSRNKRRLFERIRSAPLVFTNAVSPRAQDLIAGFLVRDPHRRLGNRATGYIEIFTHPFFSGLDWELVSRRQVPSAFRPQIKDINEVGHPDTSNFDSAFTDLPIHDADSDNEDAHLGLGSKPPSSLLSTDPPLPVDLSDNWILVDTANHCNHHTFHRQPRS